MQEEDISNDCRHDGLSRTGANAVDNACAHERAVRISFGAPNAGAEVDELAEEVHRATTEGGTDGNPEHVSVVIDQGRKARLTR